MTSAAQVRTYALLAIVTLAVVLRTYGIAAYSLAGDEYNSLVEARQLGLNWNSIIYSAVMHFWVGLGSSEVWLRLPAAAFGVAAVPLIFQAGAKLDGWRAGAVAGLLAATSPFSIYHSQEVRFYSLFIFASAVFMLATIHYAQSEKTNRSRLGVAAAGLLLLVSHFVGVVALWAQGAATFLALKRRRLSTILLVTIGVPLMLFGLLLLPPVRGMVLELYQIFGNARGANTALTPISFVSFAKIAFAGFTFVFGYHVYPLRLLLVIPGLMLVSFLIVCGIVRLIKQRRWAALGVTYGLSLVGAYLVLDSVGGRVASGVAPRHVAFVWPAFIVVVAVGLARFKRATFTVLVLATLTVNAVSLSYGWRKDWTYGSTIDYRAAAEYVSRQATPNAAVIFAGRAAGPVDVYFPKNLSRVNWSSFSQTGDITSVVRSDRLIFVSDDWEQGRRQRIDRLLRQLTQHYTRVEGRVDYPMFEYVFDRDSAKDRSSPLTGSVAQQLHQPLSLYGLEFQDLKLPVTVSTNGVNLVVSGAAQLPNLDGERVLTLSVTGSQARRLILLTNASETSVTGATLAEIVIESDKGVAKNIALRLDNETTSWDQMCQSGSACKTVFQWHKRVSITGQQSYPGAWRDFQAGIHAVSFELPANMRAEKISIRYLASSGHLYLWAIALAS